MKTSAKREQATRRGPTVVATSIEKIPPRNTSPIGQMRVCVSQDKETAAHFYDAMSSYLDALAELHNAQLALAVGSTYHVRLEHQMRDLTRMIISDGPFRRFAPTYVDKQLKKMINLKTFKAKACWACYWVVNTIDNLALENHGDAEMLMAAHHGAMFAWWQLVEAKGLDAVNAAIGAPPLLLH